MPIYEYQCESCSQRTEAIQRLSDPPLETCDECGGTLRKLLSAPSFQFKGTGWYVTDYARKGAEGKEGAKKPAAGKTSDGDKSDGGKSSDSKSSDSKSSDSKSSGDSAAASSTSSSSTGYSKSERIASKTDG